MLLEKQVKDSEGKLRKKVAFPFSQKDITRELCENRSVAT